MKKRLLTEEFHIKKGIMQTKYGQTPIAYIDPTVSENTYQYKDIIKKTYGGSWFNNLRTWGWFLGKNSTDIINSRIIPCVKFLMSKEKNNNGEPRDVNAAIDELLKILNSNTVTVPQINNGSLPTIMNEKEIEARVAQLKDELVNITNSEEFEKKFGNIIKFRNAQGGGFSIINSILIWIQDPKATLVKAEKRWEQVANKRVKKEGAIAIALWCPFGNSSKTKAQKEKIKRDFLDRVHKTDESQLTVGEKVDLIKAYNAVNAVGFKLVAKFYDVRFTEQIEGTEDIVGNTEGIDKIKWYDDTGEETQDLIQKIDALSEFIQSTGVHIEYTDSTELGNARGDSNSVGRIRLLKDDKKNLGLFNTMIHEFAHELLHFTYIKSKNPELSSEFVGTEKGRGVVEQQAELTAWIVLKAYGYNDDTNINYVALWGLNKNNAAEIFDTIANTANKIINGINDILQKNMTESIYKKCLNEITGIQVAQLVGPQAVKAYIDAERNIEIGDKMNKQDSYESDNMNNLEEESDINNIRESFKKIYKRMLNEGRY